MAAIERVQSGFVVGPASSASAPTRRAIENERLLDRRVHSRCRHSSTELEPSDAHVANVYDDHYFEGGGAGYTNYFEEGELLRERGEKYGRFA